jgi:hypothetical protein
MGPIEQEVRERCAQVLKRVEQHLKDFPVGETYFGKIAASNPYALRSLREGRILTPETLDKLSAYVDLREERQRNAAGEAAE